MHMVKDGLVGLFATPTPSPVGLHLSFSSIGKSFFSRI